MSAEPPTRSTLTLVVHLVLLVAWFLMIGKFQEGDVYAAMGPFALLAVCVLGFLHRDQLKQLLRPTRNSVLIGLVVGVGMVALTYPAYTLAASVMPWLESAVRALYKGADSAPLAQALPWTLVILFAEELLWRGTLIDVLSPRFSTRAACVTSVLTYALAQLGSGSWIVFALALGCGTIWTVMRVRADNIVAPLVAHAVWTPTVILLYPVV